MSCDLSSKVPWMNNRELNGLAQNRFVPASVQDALFHAGLRSTREYLALNPNLCIDVRDKLWSLRGYVMKCHLIASGHYSDNANKYYELYDSVNWNRSRHRMTNTFLNSGYNIGRGHKNTPCDLLTRIYSEWCHPGGKYSQPERLWQMRWLKNCISRHPNATDKIRLLIAATSEGETRKIAIENLSSVSA